MGDQSKNVLIGVFVATALAVMVFVILFLHPKVGDEGHRLRVRFADVDKIPIGTRVLFAGKPVGEVVDIQEVENVADRRIGRDGKVYIYQLELQVDSSVDVFNTDQISAKTSGLLGEKSVAITPLPPKPGEKLRIVNDEILYSYEAGGIEDMLKEIKEVANNFDVTLVALTDSIQEIKRQKLWEKVASTFQNLTDITGALNNPEELSQTLTNIRDVSDRAVQSWDTVDSILANVNTVSSEGKVITGDLKGIFGKISKGEGSVGKIVMRDDLYVKLNALLSKGDTVMNDINHYGLLFHSDKGWQRLRARRLNLLAQLSTPQEFRNYFNDEMDKVSTSLSRVSMVLEETENLGPCCDLLCDTGYAKVFAELLRRVEVLDESIKMYNQQVMDRECKNFELSDRCPTNCCQ